jgi:hypothetical protein
MSKSRHYFNLGILLALISIVAFIGYPYLRVLFTIPWVAGMLLMLISIEGTK